jgi:hypothetical protein
LSLHPSLRGQFLARIAQLLDGQEIGDGAVARAARTAQAEIMHADPVDAPRPTRPTPPKWSRPNPARKQRAG